MALIGIPPGAIALLSIGEMVVARRRKRPEDDAVALTSTGILVNCLGSPGGTGTT